MSFLLIAPLSDIPIFYIKYLTMYKVHMHAGAIKILYGCAYVREKIHSLKLVYYLSVHTHKPYNNLHLINRLMILMILHYLICCYAMLGDREARIFLSHPQSNNGFFSWSRLNTVIFIYFWARWDAIYRNDVTLLEQWHNLSSDVLMFVVYPPHGMVRCVWKRMILTVYKRRKLWPGDLMSQKIQT